MKNEETQIREILDSYELLFQQEEIKKVSEELRKLKVISRETEKSYREAVRILARQPLGSDPERIQESLNRSKYTRDYYRKELSQKQKIFCKLLNIN